MGQNLHFRPNQPLPPRDLVACLADVANTMDPPGNLPLTLALTFSLTRGPASSVSSPTWPKRHPAAGACEDRIRRPGTP
jgi:hypothetical protein